MIEKAELIVRDSGSCTYSTYYTLDEEELGCDVDFVVRIDSEGQVTSTDDVDADIIAEAGDMIMWGQTSKSWLFDAEGKVIK